MQFLEEADSPSRSTGWRLAQAVVLIAGCVLAVGLARYPVPTRDLFWQAIVPLLPLSFMVSPSLWRNVCPLATCNELGAAVGAGRRLPFGWARWASAIGVTWLVAAIVARRMLFDVSPLATAVLVGGAALTAFALGLRFARKSGFCNSLCPILPVERFYGQRPLLQIGNARCASCEACTLVGCVDLTPRRSLAVGIGGRPGGLRWLRSPVGALVGAFPGIIVAYFTLGPEPGWTATLARFAVGAAASLAVAALLSWSIVDRSKVTRLLAAASGLLYYGFATPTWAAAVGLAAFERPLQVAALLAVSLWSWRALRPEPR